MGSSLYHASVMARMTFGKGTDVAEITPTPPTASIGSVSASLPAIHWKSGSFTCSRRSCNAEMFCVLSL